MSRKFHENEASNHLHNLLLQLSLIEILQGSLIAKKIREIEGSQKSKVNKGVCLTRFFFVFQELEIMEYSDSYQNGGSRRDADFQKLAQNIGSNIQKILQNGKKTIPDFTKMVSVNMVKIFHFYFSRENSLVTY